MEQRSHQQRRRLLLAMSLVLVASPEAVSNAVKPPDGEAVNVTRGGEAIAVGGGKDLFSVEDESGWRVPTSSFPRLIRSTAYTSPQTDASPPPPPSLPPRLLRRCCPPGEVFFYGRDECQPLVNTTLPVEDISIDYVNDTFGWTGWDEFPECPPGEELRYETAFLVDTEDGEIEHFSFFIAKSVVPLCVVEDVGVTVEYLVGYCFKDVDAQVLQECDNRTCVRKCCKEGEGLHIESRDCLRSNHSTKFHEIGENTHSVFGQPQCTSFVFAPHRTIKDKFTLGEDGRLHIHSYDEALGVDEYCIDQGFHEDERDVLYPVAVACQRPGSSSCSSRGVIVVLMPLSCVFLSLTIAVYFFLPDLLRLLHGKCLMAFSFSLLVTYVVLTINHAAPLSDLTGCVVIALVGYFSWLSSFLWLNVLCFDVWNTIGSMRPMRLEPRQAIRQFIRYSIFAWGVPVVATAVATAVQFTQSSETWGHPGIGHKCWFADGLPSWLYFDGLVLVSSIANVVFLTVVICKLWKTWTEQKNKSKTMQKERLLLYAKLVGTMGPIWMFEVISKYVDGCWLAVDVINSAQGIIIFLIFVCRKQIFTQVSSASSRSVPPGRTWGQTPR
ncbi:putative G-protein coupled receptor Mth-like 3 isoform X2 [Oratosquilla oratoria]|uniref:putative G-protein coupled receptor Mth-like 3 isoform X2 n=1 Tax=Oratosquilla oratoria TaxID=337810 RepID=UPI003F76F019